MSDPVYIGTGKEIEFPSGGKMLKMSFNVKDIETLKDHFDAEGWVRIDIKQRKTPSAKGQTHYGTLNTWKPTDRANEQQAERLVEKLTVPDKKEGGDELPF